MRSFKVWGLLRFRVILDLSALRSLLYVALTSGSSKKPVLLKEACIMLLHVLSPGSFASCLIIQGVDLLQKLSRGKKYDQNPLNPSSRKTLHHRKIGVPKLSALLLNAMPKVVLRILGSTFEDMGSF